MFSRSLSSVFRDLVRVATRSPMSTVYFTTWFLRAPHCMPKRSELIDSWIMSDDSATVTTSMVRQLPTSEFFMSIVRADSRNGTVFDLIRSAKMTRPSVVNDWLMFLAS